MLAIFILFTDRHLVAFYKIIFFTLKHTNSILGEFRPIASRYWLRKDFWNDYCQWWVIPRGYLFDPLKKPQANFYQVNKSCLWYPWLCLFRLINFSFNLFILLQPTQILVRAKVELVIDAFSKRVKAILPWFLYSDPKLSIINLLILFFLAGRL